MGLCPYQTPKKWADHQHHGVSANSLLAVLNSRARLRQPIEEFKSTEMSTRFVVASRIGDHHMHVEVSTIFFGQSTCS